VLLCSRQSFLRTIAFGFERVETVLKHVIEVRNALLDQPIEALELVVGVGHPRCRLVNRLSRAAAFSARRDDRDASIAATRSGLNRRSINCSVTSPSSFCIGKARPLHTVFPFVVELEQV